MLQTTTMFFAPFFSVFVVAVGGTSFVCMAEERFNVECWIISDSSSQHLSIDQDATNIERNAKRAYNEISIKEEQVYLSNIADISFHADFVTPDRCISIIGTTASQATVFEMDQCHLEVPKTSFKPSIFCVMTDLGGSAITTGIVMAYPGILSWQCTLTPEPSNASQALDCVTRTNGSVGYFDRLK